MELLLSISEAMIPRVNEDCRRVYNDGILVPTFFRLDNAT